MGWKNCGGSFVMRNNFGEKMYTQFMLKHIFVDHQTEDLIILFQSADAGGVIYSDDTNGDEKF